MNFLSEEDLEEVLATRLASHGYGCLDASDLSPERGSPERPTYHHVLLSGRLRQALRLLNPGVPDHAVASALQQISARSGASVPVLANRRFHHLLLEGIPVEETIDGQVRTRRLHLVDWTNRANDWQVVRQMPIAGRTSRRPDLLLYLNGLPLVLIEIKGLGGADVEAAHAQVQTYAADIPNLFEPLLLCVVTDGVHARYGVPGAPFERWARWPRGPDDAGAFAAERLIDGLLAPETLLEVLRHFTVFEARGGALSKKIAAPHQISAVRKCLDAALSPTAASGMGVVWHTQGAGKSLLMAFVAARLLKHPCLHRHKILVVTDRNDLDNQLFATFAACKDLLGEDPKQADDGTTLQAMLDSHFEGRLLFSTLQKFPAASAACAAPVIVLVDEAHRSHYGLAPWLDEDGKWHQGFAKHLRDALPNARFLAFTGTPVSSAQADTHQVFGNLLHAYDIRQAVQDGITVPIHYEPRYQQVVLPAGSERHIDAESDRIAATMSPDERTAAETRLLRGPQAFALIPARLDALVDDIVSHLGRRFDAFGGGKAMVVCSSRAEAAALHARLCDRLGTRLGWSAAEDRCKVVISGGAADSPDLQRHLRSAAEMDSLRQRFQDPEDPFQVAVVCDMWLTGTDVPCLHTLYLDKTMQGHTLLQAIARVNRIFPGKTAGLVVDYAGLGEAMRQALERYSTQDRKEIGTDIDVACDALAEAIETARAFLPPHLRPFAAASDAAGRLDQIRTAFEHLSACAPDGFCAAADTVRALYRQTAACDRIAPWRNEIAFLQLLRKMVHKGKRQDIHVPSSVFDDLRRLLDQSLENGGIDAFLEQIGQEPLHLDRIRELPAEDAIRRLPERASTVQALLQRIQDIVEGRLSRRPARQRRLSERLQDLLDAHKDRLADLKGLIARLVELLQDADAAATPSADPIADEFQDVLEGTAPNILSRAPTLPAELSKSFKETRALDWHLNPRGRSNMRVNFRYAFRRCGITQERDIDQLLPALMRQAETLSSV
jgi:type I restriction enzyme R subunit